jgi:hypothetical protein
MLRPALALFLTLCGVAQAGPSMTDQRRASLDAVLRHQQSHPERVLRCGGNQGDWHTDVIAFPAGRADRLYQLYAGAGYAYRVQGGQARLVWCGRAIAPTASNWKFSGAVRTALGFPLQTVGGALPREGAMTVYSAIAGRLTTRTQDAAGRVTCQKTRYTKGQPRSSFAFDARDTCP